MKGVSSNVLDEIYMPSYILIRVLVCMECMYIKGCTSLEDWTHSFILKWSK